MAPFMIRPVCGWTSGKTPTSTPISSGPLRSTRSCHPRLSVGMSSSPISRNMWATEPNYTEEQLRSITTPFLILDGEEEEAIDLNQTKLMALLIPDAELEIMPDTGHFAVLEQPEEF